MGRLLLCGREPTGDQRFFLGALLLAIADHGMIPANVTARVTLAADPGSPQQAVAAGSSAAAPSSSARAAECARLLEHAQAKVASRGEPRGRRGGDGALHFSSDRVLS